MDPDVLIAFLALIMIDSTMADNPMAENWEIDHFQGLTGIDNHPTARHPGGTFFGGGRDQLEGVALHAMLRIKARR